MVVVGETGAEPFASVWERVELEGEAGIADGDQISRAHLYISGTPCRFCSINWCDE
jgi:hypothetical protein